MHASLRALAYRRALPIAALVAIAIALPSIAIGFYTDDYAFRARLHAPSHRAPPIYDLFRFSTGNPADNQLRVRIGVLPWWSAPELKVHFLRPLTSLLFAVDDAVFGEHAAGYHLHSLVWYLALLIAAGLLYRRVLPGPTCVLALLVFGVRHAHVLPYAWISARHLLVGAVPATLALLAHLRAREDGWRPGRWLAPAALAIGLSGSEAALGGVIFWLAYELVGPAPGRWRDRLRACAPALAVAAAYLIGYRWLGGGAAGSGGYHDPLADPGAFAEIAATRVPALIGDALLGVPAELGNVWPAGRLAIVGVVAAGAVAALYGAVRVAVPAAERAAVRWLALGAVGATVIGVSGFPGGRVLLLPDLGFAALLAVLLHRGGTALAPARPLRIAAVAVLAIVHLALAPLSSLHETVKVARRARATEAIAAAAARAAPPSGRVFLVAASDPMVFFYPRGILAHTAPGAVRCWSILSAARTAHRITRTGPRSFALDTLERPLVDGPFETLFRDDALRFVAGDTVRQCGATIRVAAVRDGKPTRLEVELDAPLESSGAATLLIWRDGELAQLAPPAIGDAIDLPWSPGPSGVL